MLRRRLALSSIALLALASVGLSPKGLASSFSLAQAEPMQAPQAQQILTVYNQGMALVRETRTFTAQAGRNQLTLGDLPAQIQPDTLLLQDVTDPQAQILGQTFRYDQLESRGVLGRQVGHTLLASAAWQDSLT